MRLWLLALPLVVASPGLFKTLSDGFFSGRSLAGMVAHDGHLFYMGGLVEVHSDYGVDLFAFNDVYKSDDGGETWDMILAHAPWGQRAGFGLVSFGGLMWVMGGWYVSPLDPTSSICLHDLWTSADGIEWTQREPSAKHPMWTPRALFGCTVFNDTMWVVGGAQCRDVKDAGTPTNNPDVWRSGPLSDGPAAGLTWHQVGSSMPLGYQKQGFAMEAFEGYLWVLGGAKTFANSPTQSLDVTNEVWRSPDGLLWEAFPSPPWGPRYLFGAAVLGDSLYAYGGRQTPASDHVLAAGRAPSADASCVVSDVWKLMPGVKPAWVRVDDDVPLLARFGFASTVAPGGGSLVIAGGSTAAECAPNVTTADMYLEDVVATLPSFPCTVNGEECSGRGTCLGPEEICLCFNATYGPFCQSCVLGYYDDPLRDACFPCKHGFAADNNQHCSVCKPGYTVDQWRGCTLCWSMESSVTVFLASILGTTAVVLGLLWALHTQVVALLAIAVPVLQIVSLLGGLFLDTDPTEMAGARELFAGVLASLRAALCNNFIDVRQIWACGPALNLDFYWLWGVPVAMPVAVVMCLLTSWVITTKCCGGRPPSRHNTAAVVSPSGDITSKTPKVEYDTGTSCCCRRHDDGDSPAAPSCLRTLFPAAFCRTAGVGDMVNGGPPVDPSLGECASSPAAFYQRCLHVCFSYLLFSYVPLVSIVMSAIPCDSAAHPGVDCNSTTYQIVLTLSGVLLVAVVAGFPAAVYCLLARQGRGQVDAAFWQRYGMLFHLFTARRLRWIVAFFARWLTQTVLIVALGHHRASRVLLCGLLLGVEALWFCSKLVARPFRAVRHSVMDSVLSLCLVAVIVAFMLPQTKGVASAAACTLGLVGLCAIVVVFVVCLLLECSSVVASNREPVPVFLNDTLLYVGDDEWHNKQRRAARTPMSSVSRSELRAPLLFLDDLDDAGGVYH